VPPEASGHGPVQQNAGMGEIFIFGQRPGLFDLLPVRAVQLTGHEFGIGLSRRALSRAADDALRVIQSGDGLPNDDTGWVLRINKKGRSKMGDNPGLSATDSKAVAALPALAQRAVVAERHADDTHHNEFVSAVYRLYVPLLIGDQLYRVKLTVKEYKPGAVVAGTMLHALSSVEIENAPLGTVPASDTKKVALQQAQPTTGRAVSVRDLLRGAHLHDGTLFVG
jgi:Large polyvalent protein-associated domain 3